MGMQINWSAQSFYTVSLDGANISSEKCNWDKDVFSHCQPLDHFHIHRMNGNKKKSDASNYLVPGKSKSQKPKAQEEAQKNKQRIAKPEGLKPQIIRQGKVNHVARIS